MRRTVLRCLVVRRLTFEAEHQAGPRPLVVGAVVESDVEFFRVTWVQSSRL